MTKLAAIAAVVMRAMAAGRCLFGSLSFLAGLVDDGAFLHPRV
jgi:hypothetical protein